MVIRSTWDYYRRLGEFETWLDHVSHQTTVHNSPEVVRWNMDKRYLRELERADIPVIHTRFMESVADIQSAEFGLDVMVKPVISAGSNDTARFVDDSSGARRFAGHLIDTGRAVMVQPYVSSIDEQGETGLVYFSGQFSHAFHKGPIFGGERLSHNGLYMEEEISPHQETSRERVLGDRVLSFLTHRFGSAPLYARVDMVGDADGEPSIMEVELIEPSLFLHVDEDAGSNAAEATISLL